MGEWWISRHALTVGVHQAKTTGKARSGGFADVNQTEWKVKGEVGMAKWIFLDGDMCCVGMDWGKDAGFFFLLAVGIHENRLKRWFNPLVCPTGKADEKHC